MKTLKIILMIVVAIVLIGAVASFILPTEYTIERSVTIQAPEAQVKKDVQYFSNFIQWNPWADADTAMVNTIEGTDGTVGAKYSWVGNDDVGVGSMTITAITDSRIDMDLNFVTPWEANDKNWYKWEKTPEGVVLTWGMGTTMARPMNLMGAMMEGMIGEKYETGLNRVKERAEAASKQTNFRGFEVKEMTMSPRSYIVKKDTVGFDAMQAFMGEHFGAIFGALGKKKIEAIGAPSAIYYMWDEANMRTVVAIGAPVASGGSLPGYESVPVEGKALHIAYYGDYAGSAEAHYAMDDYLVSRGAESTLVIEEYVTDPGAEPDTAKWLTNIYYLVK
ncbi:SRPBCC family protein [Cytophagales bacterium LB-30]|uniref:SRPBCC family protein n=1 Tax=Shiella aurantiaca TaxID=3058365 RepID=A0ABT8F3U3_9BACT|nr:SRPBCC family protein [Shiella aurantiaca]MDN4165127.1 SRPBCC family protein [Shiella aurantiaca]